MQENKIENKQMKEQHVVHKKTHTHVCSNPSRIIGVNWNELE